MTEFKGTSQYTKTCFDSVSDKETRVLILGTLPGDKSLELQQYYGHPRNRFWKVIATITGESFPETYEARKKMLLDNRIALWDVAHRADRKGSLDSAIEREVPNDLDAFISRHKQLRAIAFNGAKAAALYGKYFDQNPGLIYFSLPSTSPANARMNLVALCKVWGQLSEFLGQGK